MFSSIEIILITLTVILTVTPAIISRRYCFFRYLVFNFFAFSWLWFTAFHTPYPLYVTGEFFRAYFYFPISVRDLFPIVYTPVYCYFLSDYEKSKSLFNKIFTILNIIMIVFVIYFMNLINLLLFPYFILSLAVFVFLKKENILKKAGQATTIALGLFCLFEPYYVSYFNSFYYAFSGYLQSFLDIRVSLFQHDISVLEIMMYCLLLLYIIIAIILVTLFSNCVSVKKTHHG